MARATVSKAALLQILIDETGKLLTSDAHHIIGKITIAHRRGEPNWDASIGMVALTTLKAFEAALGKTQKLYDHDLAWF
jgi:hypothetical protein